MADITPRPHVLLALANQRLSWWQALAELVDNSFDAGATRVVIRYSASKKAVIVEDDGSGVRDVLALVTLGYHDPSATTSLGMYGIGAKDAWVFTGGVIDIDTVRNGTRTRLFFDGREQANWTCVDPVIEPSTAPSGTVLTLPLHGSRKPPTNDAFDRLAFVFTPALRRGLQIVRTSDGKTKLPLEPCKMPTLAEVVSSEFEIAGKHVAIEIGMLPDGATMKHGPFWLQYKHRVIDSTSIGANGYSTRRLAGTIALGSGWKLTKNKDDLTEGNKEALADAIFSRIEPLLARAERLAESIESQLLRHELESVLNEAVASQKKRREKRDSGETHGTVSPVNTGRKRKNAAKSRDLPGSVVGGDSPAGRKRGFNLDWCDDDPAVLGKFESLGARVSLNLQHPFIDFAKSTGNRVALLSAAWTLICEHAVTHRGDNKLLAVAWESFADAFSAMSSSYAKGVAADGQSAKAAG